jgi:hypothetical protein
MTLSRGKEALDLRIVVCMDRRIMAVQSVLEIRVNSRDSRKSCFQSIAERGTGSAERHCMFRSTGGTANWFGQNGSCPEDCFHPYG